MRTFSRTALMAAALLAVGPAVAVDQLPWEIWNDLGELARLRLDHRLVMSSSRCPDGCAYDRHSDGDPRFVRMVGDEGVIFEAEGAGAITRIWMTQGDAGVSLPLDPKIRLRLTVDGSPDPVLDLPLSEAFGATAPFEPPLALDRTASSGGNVSVVPMAFRDGCRLSLVGAETARIWFQVTGHRLASSDGVVSFTGDEDLSTWRTLLASPGSDPWIGSGSHPWMSGQVSVEPGETRSLGDFVGPESLTGLLLDTVSSAWAELEIVLDFDGQPTQMPLLDFFAIGRAGSEPTRSLLIGVDDQQRLYSWFPMPYFRTASVAVRLTDSAAAPVNVGFAIRRRNHPPAADSGLFGARLEVTDESVAGRDSVLLELDGPGRWVGLFLETGSIGTGARSFLEGDERIHIDGSIHPTLYGTGVEDFFGGGFYFRVDDPVSTPFRLALNGFTYELTDATGRAMGMYRLMLSDGPVFGSSLRVGLEGGPENQTEIRLRAVSYFYRRPTSGLRLRDALDVGDDESRVDHLYAWTGDQGCTELDALFEDEPPTRLETRECTTSDGATSFILRGAKAGQQLVLRRRFDNDTGDQRATISVAGGQGIDLHYEDANPHRRWRERDTPLGLWDRDGEALNLSVAVGPTPGFSESVWELWAGYPPGTCDLVLDGVCDAADAADAVRRVDSGLPVDQLLITLGATFD